MEENIMIFLGHPTEYWLELEKKAQELNLVRWLEEIATLRGKVGFYESRISEMNDFRETRSFNNK